MTNVVSLDQHKRENSPHISGPAICLGCGHKWYAICPVPVPEVLECPSCGLEKGHYQGLIAPPPDANTIFICNCSNIRFLSQPEGMFCECCGVLHTWSDMDNA